MENNSAVAVNVFLTAQIALIVKGACLLGFTMMSISDSRGRVQGPPASGHNHNLHLKSDRNTVIKCSLIFSRRHEGLAVRLQFQLWY